MQLISTNASIEEIVYHQLSVFIMLRRIENTQYLRPRIPVLKSGNLHLAFSYGNNPQDYERFPNMLRVLPQVLYALHDLIKDHTIFSNNSSFRVSSFSFDVQMMFPTVFSLASAGILLGDWVYRRLLRSRII
jgi:hypothetical protein